MLRWARRLAALALLGMVAYVGLTFVQVWRASRRDQARPAQAIVVLGAAQYNGRPSAVLRARLDHAASLYKQGFAPTVVVTGGRQPGDQFTEAGTSAAYLAKLGVPDSAVLREVSGRTSWQSLASAAAFLKRRGVHTVLLVSDGFHAARIVAIAHELGLKGYASPTRTSPIKGRRELGYMVRETFSVAAGRIVGFRRAAGIAGRARGVVGTG